MDDGMINVEIISEAPRMSIVLKQRVLERKVLAKERLSPFVLIFGTEYPASHILGFYNEQAKRGNE